MTVPFDTVLFLRPTESLSVFLQQLGRGLRLYDGKDCLTVLDFIGQAHRSFRFDLRFRALIADPTVSLEDQVEGGFPHLPAGCTIQLERIARQHIFENIRQTIRQSRPTLIREVRDLARDLGRPPTLSEFLEREDLDPDDIYRRQVCWSRLSVEAGIRQDFADPDEPALTKGFRRLEHVNSPEHIRFLMNLLEAETTDGRLDDAANRRLLMMDLCLWGQKALPRGLSESLQRLIGNPVLRGELIDLLRYRLGQVDSIAPSLTLPFPCPLTLHALYTRDEILAGLGHWTRTVQKEMREGVLHLPAICADAFFFTLHKTEKQYSPTTMYQDYAINEHLLHWQSQSTTSADSPTGQRYIEHESRKHTILLFGREYKHVNGLAAPYFFLGPARYVSHTGSRPVSISWKLDYALPAKLLRRMARLATA